MEESRTGICVEYCHPIDGASSKGGVILANDGDYSLEEMHVLFELGMIRYQRRFGEILFRPSEIAFPNLLPPPGTAPVVPHLRLISEAPQDLHRIISIRLVHGARDDVHPSASALVDRLEAMIEKDRKARRGSILLR